MTVLLITASPLETEGYSFNYTHYLNSVVHIISGVGKLNAYAATRKALRSNIYDLVINAGTCGSVTNPVGTVLHPGVVCQPDVNSCFLDPLDRPGNMYPTIGEHLCTCGTSDHFFTTKLVADAYSCRDMEAYAVLKATYGMHDIDTELVKVVSDDCHGSVHSWETELPKLRSILAEAIKETIKRYISDYTYAKVPSEK